MSDPTTVPAVANPAATTVPAGQATPGEEQIDWQAKATAAEQQLAAEAQARAQAEQYAAQIEQQRNQELAALSMAAERAQRQQWQREFDEGQISSTELNRRVDQAVDAANARAQKIVAQELMPYHTQQWAVDVATRYGLTAEEYQQVAQAPGENMEFVASQLVERRNFVPATRVQELESKLDQLQRSMTAQNLSGSGLGVTLQGNPGGQGNTAIEPGTPAHLAQILRNPNFGRWSDD